ncbi:hypothetical protein MCOR07_010710 [Pyricularia oryzae]|nr:hypothetical protein MCOR32_001220 [Pyricularia oryzae]KAI6610724.1 hypothetical protein MCOR07_010710 [Pyricularia oryzae]
MRFPVLLGLAQITAANVVPRQSSSTVDVGKSTLTADPADLDGACSLAIRTAATNTKFRPSLALNCLQSIPVDVNTDLTLLDQLTYHAETLSTLGYLKAPPAGYLIPGVDIMGAFDEMRKKLKDGKYANQYHFMEEVFNVYHAASESHFTWRPMILNAFTFSRGLNLVSVSQDGIELPKVYAEEDFMKSQGDGYKASPIVSIDGSPIEDVIARESFNVLAQDPDAKYNQLMQGHGIHSIGGEFWKNWHTAGVPDMHNVTFANSSTAVYVNSASYSGGVTGIQSAEDISKAYLLPTDSEGGMSAFELNASDDGSFASAISAMQLNSVSKRDIEPRDLFKPERLKPFVSHKLGMMYGYFLDKPDFTDVCVLAIPSFSSNGTSNFRTELEDTRRVAREFVSKCKAANRNRIVLDVSGNGGGNYAAGVELFRNFFPKAEHRQAYSFRVSPFMRYLATNMDDVEKTTFYQQDPREYKPSFDEFFKPSSDIKQDALTGHVLIEPSSIASNFGGDAIDTSKEPPFKADDVIILSDGHAGSTCAGIVSLFYREAGVRVVAFGGRPLERPMQGIGGTRGGFGYDEPMFRNLSDAFNAGGRARRPDPPSGVKRPPRWPLAVQSLFNWRTNWNNEFAVGAAADAVPLHFSYEAAHCRRFYRAENVVDHKTTWADAAAVAWKGAKCVKGSTVNGDATIGQGGMDGAPAFSEDVRSRQRYVGLGAVNNGVAATGQLPPQGGRKAGSGPGGGGGGGGGDSKKDAADGLRASVFTVGGVAALAAALLVV